MGRFARLVVYALAAYFYFRVGFPDGQGAIYHILAPMFLIALAALCHFLLGMFESAVGSGIFAFELLFIVVVAGFMAFTLPQASGVPPYRQWLDNGRPTRATASGGLSKLGLDPNSAVGRAILATFR